MYGRVEKENNAKLKMEQKLKDLPKIFHDFYIWMDVREKSFTTMRNYINHTIEFMNFLYDNNQNENFYEQVTDLDIERYMMYIRNKQVGDDIRAAKWSSLNTFFKFLMQKKYINKNPMLLTERPRIKTTHEIVYLTKQEIDSIFDSVRRNSRQMTKNRDLCIIALALSTGLRVSAIVNINIEDIDFKNNNIKVIEKGRKIRKIDFSDHLREIIAIWLKDRELYYSDSTTGALFLSQLKNRISVDAVEKLVTKYTNHISKKITPHKFRSSAAMNLRSAGIDVITIASILGHENITTTQRYIKAYDEDKQKATKILDNLI